MYVFVLFRSAFILHPKKTLFLRNRQHRIINLKSMNTF